MKKIVMVAVAALALAGCGKSMESRIDELLRTQFAEQVQAHRDLRGRFEASMPSQRNSIMEMQKAAEAAEAGDAAGARAFDKSRAAAEENEMRTDVILQQIESSKMDIIEQVLRTLKDENYIKSFDNVKELQKNMQKVSDRLQKLTAKP